MLIEISIIFESSNDRLSNSTRSVRSLGWIDQINSHAKPRLSRVHLHLSVLLVLFPLGFDLVNSLFKHDLQLSLRSKLFIVLLASHLEQFPLMLHHFT